MKILSFTGMLTFSSSRNKVNEGPWIKRLMSADELWLFTTQGRKYFKFSVQFSEKCPCT